MDDVPAKGEGWRGGADGFLDIDASNQDRRGGRTDAAAKSKQETAQEA
jgi:hypothetical protein